MWRSSDIRPTSNLTIVPEWYIEYTDKSLIRAKVSLDMFELVWLTLLEHLKMKLLQVDKLKNGLPAYRIILWATTKVTIEIYLEKTFLQYSRQCFSFRSFQYKSIKINLNCYFSRSSQNNSVSWKSILQFIFLQYFHF